MVTGQINQQPHLPVINNRIAVVALYECVAPVEALGNWLDHAVDLTTLETLLFPGIC